MQRRFAASSSALPPLWLAASYGRQVARETEPQGEINSPEAPMTVVFEGLTEDEQRRALASFPGGKRFILAPPRH